MGLLILSTLINCVLAVGIYLLEKYTSIKKLKYLPKQIIIGVLFGGASAFASSFGVEWLGAVVNVRDAAPLTAGLIFGGPAGIIAGCIGGLYRFLSVYWGAGEYTQIACSLATILAGFMAAGVRKWMFDGKKPNWIYGLCIAIACEVIHMILIFVTNMDNSSYAFEFVKGATLPMIIGNGCAVGISLLIISLFNIEKGSKKTEGIANTFQRWLLICIAVAFIATSLFTYFLQNGIVKEKGHSYSLVDNKDGTHTKICDNDNNHIITENCGWEYISNNDGTKTATCECGSKNVLIDESVFIVENGKLTGITEYGKTLKKLVILDSVTSIKAGALKGCDVLEEITLPFIGASQTANSGYNQVFGYIFGYEVTQAMSIVNPEVAAGAIRQYKGDVPGGPSLKNFYDYYVPKTLRKVTVKADGVLRYGFENCNMLNTVEIVGAVTTIEANLFAGCKELKDLILSNTVSTISNDAFNSCSGLQNVYYYGSAEEFLSITVGSNNTNFTNATRYYYVVNQEDVPNDGGNYWHYNEKGEIVVWDINQ